MQNRAIDAVIFDLDNTLTDFMLAKENSVRAAVDAMIDCGLPLNHQDAVDCMFALYKEIGIENQKIFNVFLDKTIGRVDDRILAAAVVAYRRARGGSLVPYPHVKFVLNQLIKQGYKLAVVSDAPRFEAWLRLNYIGLQHAFDVVLTFDDTGHHKPDPTGFLMALDLLGVEPGRALLIGDWVERDILGGQNAGLHTVYARYGDKYSQYADKVEGQETQPDFVVDDLLQLLNVLDQLNGVKK